MRSTSMFSLLSAWMLVGATAAAQNIDALPEGTSATVLSLTGGVTLRDLDQGLGTAPDPFVIDDASTALLRYDIGSPLQNNVVSFGDHLPGGDNLYGRCKSFRLVFSQPTPAAYFRMWISRADAGNSVQLDMKLNGQVAFTWTIPIAPGTAPFFLRLNPHAQHFDEIQVTGIGPSLGGAFHGVIDLDAFTLGGVFDFAPNCDGGANSAHTPCPCGNNSNQFDSEGCTNSFGYGGRLRVSGNPSISADTFQLVCMQLPPNSPALFFQGTVNQNNGLGTVFGDGLRCAGGTIRRLAVKQSQNGFAYYPEAGDASISVQGQVTTVGARTYQAWYRNVGPFCSNLPFNLSNGFAVGWSQ